MSTLVPLDDVAKAALIADDAAAAAADDVARWGLHVAGPAPRLAAHEAFAVRRGDVEIGRLALTPLPYGPGGLVVRSLWVPPELRGRGLGHQLLLVAESEVRRRRLRMLLVPVRTSSPAGMRIARRSAGLKILGSTRRLDLGAPLARATPVRPVVDREADLKGMTVYSLHMAMALRTLHVDERRRVAAVGAVHHPDVPLGGIPVAATAAKGADRLPEVLAGAGELLRAAGSTHADVELMASCDPLLPESAYPVREWSLAKHV